jgi:hypothetical protein
MSTLKSLKCPSCGAPITKLLATGVFQCSFCHTQVVQEADSNFNSAQQLCDCGQCGKANCKRCRAWLCDKHALTLAQFDLNRILKAAFPTIPYEGAYRQAKTITGTLGPDTIYCAGCFDTLLDQWLVGIAEERKGG